MIERALLAAGLLLLGVCLFLAFRARHLRRATRRAAALGKPAILYFRGDFCLPCQAQGRFLQELQALLGDQIYVERIDAHVEREKAAQYGVFTVPTTLVMDARGTVRHANYGLADVHKLAGQLQTVGVVTHLRHLRM